MHASLNSRITVLHLCPYKGGSIISISPLVGDDAISGWRERDDGEIGFGDDLNNFGSSITPKDDNNISSSTRQNTKKSITTQKPVSLLETLPSLQMNTGGTGGFGNAIGMGLGLGGSNDTPPPPTPNTHLNLPLTTEEVLTLTQGPSSSILSHSPYATTTLFGNIHTVGPRARYELDRDTRNFLRTNQQEGRAEEVRLDEGGGLERSDSSISPTTVTNNLPFVASLLTPLFASLVAGGRL